MRSGVEDWRATATEWDKRELPLAVAVVEKARSLRARFHVPGHQGMGLPPLGDRWGSAFGDDLTELEGLDNLAGPTGAIAAAQGLAAATFGADQTWFLVNGSTVGIQAALLAIARTHPPGAKIIIGRNAHQSALTGLVLGGLRPVWVQPEVDPHWVIATHVTPEAIAQALADHPDACAVCLVSPTYYGTTSDIGAIATLCRQRHIPLIIDEAHGGHFCAHPDLPQPALAAGATIAIQSAHKTLGSLTQSAFLHYRSPGNKFDGLKNSLSDSLRVLQSSSPSYLLMASLDMARSHLQHHGYQDWQRALALAQNLRDRLRPIPKLAVLEHPNQDLTRVVIGVSQLGWTGYDLDEYLDRQGIAVEIGDHRAIGLVITPQTRPAAVDLLVAALRSLPAPEKSNGLRSLVGFQPPSFLPLCSPSFMTPREAWFTMHKPVAVDEAIGKICGEWICPYPPGIPVVLPGEKVTTDAVHFLRKIQAIGGELSGLSDPTFQSIQVIDER